MEPGDPQERGLGKAFPLRCHLSRRRYGNSHADTQGKGIPGCGKLKYKGPEVGSFLWG